MIRFIHSHLNDPGINLLRMLNGLTEDNWDTEGETVQQIQFKYTVCS